MESEMIVFMGFRVVDRDAQGKACWCVFVIYVYI